MYIAIDVGGTNTRLAGAHSLESTTFATDPIRRKNVHDFADDMQFMIDSALSLAGGQPINAVGVGAPGMPMKNKSGILASPNLASWVGKPLVESLSKGLGCPVYYDNDAIAAGLGEAYFVHVDSSFHYIIWGTGVGGVDVYNSGTKITINELPWQLYFKGWESGCGGAEIAKLYGKAPETFTDDDWQKVYIKFAERLKKHIATTRTHQMVFGGSLAERHAGMIEQLNQELEIDLSVTKFAGDSGLVGGLGLIRHNLQQPT